MDALEHMIAAIRALPSPEGCGCAHRKERLLAWLERDDNPIRRSLPRTTPPPIRQKGLDRE